MHLLCLFSTCAHVCRVQPATDCKWVNSALTAATVQLICVLLVRRSWRSPAADYTTAMNLLWYSALFVPRTMSLFASPSFTFTLTSMYLKVPSGSISTSGILARASAIVAAALPRTPETRRLLTGLLATDNMVRSHTCLYLGWHVRFLS